MELLLELYAVWYLGSSEPGVSYGVSYILARMSLGGRCGCEIEKTEWMGFLTIYASSKGDC